jgi:hypothetical protein
MINPTSLEPDDFVPPNPDPPQSATSPATVANTIKLFEPKNSLNKDGISTKLLRKIALAICTALSHIFNRCIKNGIFPERFKTSCTVPIFKPCDPTTTGLYHFIIHVQDP